MQREPARIVGPYRNGTLPQACSRLRRFNNPLQAGAMAQCQIHLRRLVPIPVPHHPGVGHSIALLRVDHPLKFAGGQFGQPESAFVISLGLDREFVVLAKVPDASPSNRLVRFAVNDRASEDMRGLSRNADGDPFALVGHNLRFCRAGLSVSKRNLVFQVPEVDRQAEPAVAPRLCFQGTHEP